MTCGSTGVICTSGAFTPLESAKYECDDVGVTQLCSGAFAFMKCGASLRAWHVPTYRNAMSRKIINFFIVLSLIITIVYYIISLINRSQKFEMAAFTSSRQRLWRSVFWSGFDVIEHTFIHFINNLQKYKNFNTIFPLGHFFLHFSFLDLSSCISVFYKKSIYLNSAYNQSFSVSIY